MMFFRRDGEEGLLLGSYHTVQYDITRMEQKADSSRSQITEEEHGTKS
jgi:hypothetical protein